MNTNKIVELLSYTLPAIVTGVVAYQSFLLHIKNENKRRNYLLHKASQKISLPTRLQAYERMTIFLERISLHHLLIRITPNSNHKIDYEQRLVAQIEQEFEHNLSQQIYISAECWSVIVTAKNATIQMIRMTAKKETIIEANQIREVLLGDLINKTSPSDTALAFIKSEVQSLLGEF